VLAVLALALTAAAAAAATCPRTSVTALEDKVMCEVCGTPLALAGDAPQAQRERALIARLVRRCATEQQVEAALVAQFGPAVLALPPHRGFAASAYLVPLAALVLAAAAVALAVARHRRRAPPAVRAAPGLADDDARRVASELERFGV
jgi:cytochrome c-type biogenesis protein CcmH